MFFYVSTTILVLWLFGYHHYTDDIVSTTILVYILSIYQFYSLFSLYFCFFYLLLPPHFWCIVRHHIIGVLLSFFYFDLLLYNFFGALYHHIIGVETNIGCGSCCYSSFFCFFFSYLSFVTKSHNLSEEFIFLLSPG